ncbi:uncharacterized protein LOC117223806 isoform X4 [Megalopta genalis]|uniref:uncharacterized protein LOC117223806 isoform X4 n=1 Tax=Megalopta genalis TaxID=115081 RepID=UPI003FD11938
MKLLRLIFKLITLCGCWRPASWNSTPWRYLYNVYAILFYLILHLVFFGAALDLALIVDNQNDFSENVFKTTGFAINCYKLFSMLFMKENIAALIDTLQTEPFAPVSDEELEIRTKFDKSAEKTAKVYTTVLEVWAVWTVVGTLLMNFASRTLLYRVWLPFDYTSATMYSLVSLHHSLATIVCVTISVAYDGLFAGLLVHIYSQFEILRHRLRNVHRNEIDSVKHCARHHDQIYNFRLQSLEVPDMIFESEWTSLSNNTKKILLMMMRRATVPIELSSLHIVTVNLETFKALIKMSYSVFSLLQRNQ